MTYYVERVFGRGIIPNGLPAFNYERRELLSKLLCQKEKARALIAPSGYGKTALAASYAQMVFSFKNTAWFDCDSPCLLRDLSSGKIKEHLDEGECEIELCVFDELPHLAEADTEKFEILIDALLKKGIEVLITCAPETRNDFLLSDKYFKMLGNDLLINKDNIDSIPALEYPTGDATALFNSTRTYGLYRKELLVYYCAMVLESGSFDDIGKIFDKKIVKRTFEAISSVIPHVHVDLYKRKFRCASLNIADIARGFSFGIDEIIRTSKFNTAEEFYETLAKLLIDANKCDRAKELVRQNMKVEERLNWALDNSTVFSDMHQSQDIVECLTSTPQQMGSLRAEVNTCLCHLFFQLKNRQIATTCATRVLSSRKAPNSGKGYVALMACYMNPCEDVSEFEETMLEFLGVENDSDYFEKPFSSLRFTYHDICFLKDFIIVWKQDPREGILFLLQHIDNMQKLDVNKYSEEAFCFCASFIFRSLLKAGSNSKSLNSAFKRIFLGEIDFANTQEMLGALIAFCFDCLKKYDITDVVSKEISDASDYALRVCEEFCSDYVTFANSNCIEAIKDYRRDLEREKFYAETYWTRANSSPSIEESRIAKPSYDKIKLSFFGGLSVEIEGKRSACKISKRKNAVYLLYLLSENLGKEITRDVLIGHIWPGTVSSDANRRNFYNALSTIKNSFSEETNTEFLRRNPTGYYLDSDLCSTDIDEFQTFCNYLNFNAEKAIRNMTQVAECVQHFALPLLPQINKFPRLEMLRKSYQNQLVDALVFASVTSLELKDYRSALWFAKRGTDIDRNREDAYYLIMKAQSGMNLRSSAVSTFFECKNILDQELGILPSSEIKDLYQTVIS